MFQSARRHAHLSKGIIMIIRYWNLFFACFFVFLSCPVLAATYDTVSYFSPKKGYLHYTKPDIALQFARFPTITPVLLHSVSVTLMGKAGQALLHFYGEEGGSSVPLLKQELLAPIPIIKTRVGVETITVTLPESLRLSGSQFFIGVDNLPEGMYLATDRFRRKPRCISGDSRYYYQVMQFSDGRFEYGEFAYAVSVVTEPLMISSPVYQMDTTVFPQGAVLTKEEYRNICVADINSDGYDDILANGRFYANYHGVFTEEHIFGNALGKEMRSITIDFNNDGRVDILTFPSEQDTLGCIMYGNTIKGFVPQRLNVAGLRTITSLSVADVNSDGFADIFIGQYSPAKGIRSKILLNSHGETLVDNPASSHIPPLNYSRGSFLADLDADGKVELFVAGSGHQANYFSSIGKTSGLQLQTSPVEGDINLGRNGIGGMPSDVDADGDQDVVFTTRSLASDVSSLKTMEAVHSLTGLSGTQSGRNFLPYVERASGGVCADVNNDGIMDIFLPTACICNSARLYLGGKDGFTEVTESYGLSGIKDARDAVFFDADNNGTLDLVVFSEGRLQFYRNTGTGSGGYIRLSLHDRLQSGHAGAQVITYVSGDRQRKILVSGRGILMQDPSSVVIGMGDDKQIDSVIVIWNTPEQTTERFGPYIVNSSHSLERGQGTASSAGGSSGCIVSDASAYPNPFTTATEIGFTLSQASPVSVIIYSFGGSQFTELYSGMLDSGSHTFSWDGNDKSGSPASTGLYMYKIKTDGCEISGQMRLQR